MYTTSGGLSKSRFSSLTITQIDSKRHGRKYKEIYQLAGYRACGSLCNFIAWDWDIDPDEDKDININNFTKLREEYITRFHAHRQLYAILDPLAAAYPYTGHDKFRFIAIKTCMHQDRVANYREYYFIYISRNSGVRQIGCYAEYVETDQDLHFGQPINAKNYHRSIKYNNLCKSSYRNWYSGASICENINFVWNNTAETFLHSVNEMNIARDEFWRDKIKWYLLILSMIYMRIYALPNDIIKYIADICIEYIATENRNILMTLPVYDGLCSAGRANSCDTAKK